jgi:hypothetical protein
VDSFFACGFPQEFLIAHEENLTFPEEFFIVHEEFLIDKHSKSLGTRMDRGFPACG